MGHASVIMFTVIICHYNKYNWETLPPHKNKNYVITDIIICL